MRDMTSTAVMPEMPVLPELPELPVELATMGSDLYAIGFAAGVLAVVAGSQVSVVTDAMPNGHGLKAAAQDALDLLGDAFLDEGDETP